MLFAAEAFARCGFEASVYGIELSCGEYEGVSRESSAAAALRGADYAVLPPLVSRDGENIFAPFSKNKIPVRGLDFGGALVFSGTACPKTAAKTLCYTLCESFACGNALPTAESAVKIAMEETKRTVFGMRACVLGFGRIGKLLSKDLLALGASVAVFARREEARALAREMGAQACDFGALSAEIGSYDCVFNTVPENVIFPEALSKIKRGAPIIELASPPGGVKAAEAEKAGVRLVAAGGLPGKIMPRAAGEIVFKTLKEMMDEEEKR